VEGVKVWIGKRKLAKGKTAYDLRFYSDGKLCSKFISTDYKRALSAQEAMREKLSAGTYRHPKRITWAAFVEDHCLKIDGKENRRQARHALTEFGRMMHIDSPRAVTFALIERYAAELRDKNAAATIAKKLRYVRAGLNAAKRRRYIGESDFDNSVIPAVEHKVPRVLTNDESGAILSEAKKRDTRLWALILTALESGCRRQELLQLTWDRVDFDESRMLITATKSHHDRHVPLTPEAVQALRKTLCLTMKDGGPFIGMNEALTYGWAKVCEATGVKAVFHDCRRTCATRLIRAGTPLPTVMKWGGWRTMSTLLKYYALVDDGDLQAARDKLAELVG
jgi:integrase